MDAWSYLTSLLSSVHDSTTPAPSISYSMPPDTSLDKRKQIAGQEAKQFDEGDMANTLQSWVSDQQRKPAGSFNLNPPIWLSSPLESRLDAHIKANNAIVKGLNNIDDAVQAGKLTDNEIDQLNQVTTPYRDRFNTESHRLKSDILKEIQDRVDVLRHGQRI